MAINQLRAIVAKQVASTTGLTQEQILPLVSLLPVSKTRCGGELSLSIKSLNHLQHPGRKTSKNELQDYANSIARKIACPEHVENIGIDQAYIHFKIKGTLFVQRVLSDANIFRDQYSFLRNGEEKKNVVIEYSSPNIAKPFHAGHLRSTVIGHFLSNLHTQLGHQVTTINYLGDWGVQFGMLAAGLKRHGKSASMPTRDLFDIYVKANKEAQTNPEIRTEARHIFQKMEEGDESILSGWREIRDVSIQEYSTTYQRLGIHFDEYSGESMYRDSAQKLLHQLQQNGQLKKTKSGTHVIDLSPDDSMSKFATLSRSDGTSMYLSRDLAAVIDRYNRYKFDLMYYVVDKSQSDHFSQLFQTLKKIGHSWSDKCSHVAFGRVLGMSTRMGEVVFLQDILDKTKKQMLRNMEHSKTTKILGNDAEDIAESLGISAIIVQDLKARLESDYTFEWDRALKSRGDTGVFLQYTHARLSSIQRVSGVPLNPDADAALLIEEEAIKLVHHLALYEGAIQSAYRDLEPRHIVHYLFKLCHLISSGNIVLQVKDASKDVAEARLLLLCSSQRCLSNAMKLLGITPLHHM